MRFYLAALSLLPLLLSLAGCQTVSQNSHSADVNSGLLPLATAVQVDYQDEVNLLHINQLFSEKKFSAADQQARLFYERGLIYDRMGLIAHSRHDFSQAISVDPAFSPAYNSLGVYLLLAGAYNDAFDMFDSALELSKGGMQYSYLHRAIGLYQIKRYSLASQDIETFYNLDIYDPYRILWRYIIESKVDPQAALTALQDAEKLSNDKRFAWALVDVIAGRTTELQFLKRISYGVSSNKELAQRLCEAYFYLAHWHQMSGDLNRAIHYFKLSTSTNIHDFIEYKYSLMELASIQAMLKSQLEKRQDN